jgi:hypothetical protein
MEHIKCKISRRKEIIKMRAKINEIETNTKTQRSRVVALKRQK